MYSVIIDPAWNTISALLEGYMLVGFIIISLIGFSLFKSYSLSASSKLLIIIFAHLIFIIFIGYNPIMGTQNVATIQDDVNDFNISEYSEPKLVNVPEDKGLFQRMRFQSLIVVSSNNNNTKKIISKSSNGQIQDQIYSDEGVLRLSNHNKNKPNYFILQSFDRNNSLVSEEKVEISYSKIKVKKGFAYSNNRSFTLLGIEIF